MADGDIDPFGEHGKTDETIDEPFPLTPRAGGTNVVTNAQVHVESGKGLSSARARLEAGFIKEKVEKLYEILSEHLNQNVIYYEDFEPIRRELYFEGRGEPLTN